MIKKLDKCKICMYITTPQTLECLISNRDIKTDNYTQTKIVDISKFCINRIISSFWLAVAFSDQKLLKISFFLHLCNASMETFVLFITYPF